MFSIENDPYTPLVRQVMNINDITWGTNPTKPGPKDFLVRYRGQLIFEDSVEAYEKLEDLVRPMNLTPLFRIEEGQHCIQLLQGRIQPKPSNPVWNLVMFVLSAFSVLLAGVMYTSQAPVPENVNFFGAMLFYLSQWKIGLPFAISFIAILGAHEFGHYLAARYHKTAVTLPYFMPFPFSPFGTLGAFIQIKEMPRNKRSMLDIGLAGPLAGLIVAIPVLIYGLSISKIDTLPQVMAPGTILSLEGNSILYLLLKLLVKGELLPAPATYAGVQPLFYWIRYVLTSTPLPYGARDVMMSPVAWAGWAGLLVTSLNLIPAGQLDGGHLIYVLIGKAKALKLWPFILIGLGLLGLVWTGWFLWLFLIFWLGRVYMEPLDQITPLDPKRRVLAVIGIILFFLVFMPVPLTQVMVGNGF